MSFSLQAIDEDGRERDDYLSLSNRSMAELRELLNDLASTDQGTPVARLMFNDGTLVDRDDCSWIASHLRRVDRDTVMRSRPHPEELLELVDSFAAFCDLCAGGGGFEVW